MQQCVGFFAVESNVPHRAPFGLCWSTTSKLDQALSWLCCFLSTCILNTLLCTQGSNVTLLPLFCILIFSCKSNFMWNLIPLLVLKAINNQNSIQFKMHTICALTQPFYTTSSWLKHELVNYTHNIKRLKSIASRVKSICNGEHCPCVWSRTTPAENPNNHSTSCSVILLPHPLHETPVSNPD